MIIPAMYGNVYLRFQTNKDKTHSSDKASLRENDGLLLKFIAIKIRVNFLTKLKSKHVRIKIVIKFLFKKKRKILVDYM